MMKKLYFFLIAASVSIGSFAQTTWKADPNHSKLTFGVTHMGISEVTGLFKTFEVTATTNKSDFSDAVFDLSTDVASINTEVDMRDNHLKGPDFFDVEKYPKMTFKSTSIKSTGKDKYKLSGDLTLHGITKPITMDLWYRGTIVNPQSKAPVSGFQLTGTIKRTDFDFGSKFAAPMLSDEVQIKADGEFKKQ